MPGAEESGPEAKPWLVTPVGREELALICRAAFGKCAEILHCEPVQGVQFNTCYHISVDCPKIEAILRIAPPDDKELFSFERHMMAAEPGVYDMIRRAGVPTPEILVLDTSRSVLPRSFMFTKYIDSVRMNDPSIPPEARPGLHRELGRHVARVHDIVGCRFGWPTPGGGVRGHEGWAQTFGELMAEMRWRSVQAGIVSPEESASLEGILTGNRRVFDEVGPPRLVHNDIWDPNVMVREHDGEWHIAAILDADRAMFADREMEFVLWNTSCLDFYEGYCTQLDPSPEAGFRRRFYRLYLAMFCAWAYRVQIWKPTAFESSRESMRAVLGEILDAG